jgi:hypothetical protein
VTRVHLGQRDVIATAVAFAHLVRGLPIDAIPRHVDLVARREIHRAPVDRDSTKLTHPPEVDCERLEVRPPSTCARWSGPP